MTLALLALATQIPAISFSVEEIPLNGSPRKVGSSKMNILWGERDSKNIVWTYEASDKMLTWRREWTYEKNGDLSFHSYDVAFGDFTRLWKLTKTDGKWELTGSPTKLTKKLNLKDPSQFWFFHTPVKMGSKVGISILNPVEFSSDGGSATFVRDERLPGKPNPFHVIDKRAGDTIEVWWVNDRGMPGQIDLIFPASNSHTRFISE